MTYSRQAAGPGLQLLAAAVVALLLAGVAWVIVAGSGTHAPPVPGEPAGRSLNMTPGRALELWPQLQATGMRLISPAAATGAATPGGWLDQFMTGARQRGYRVDAIALHWYGSDFRPGAAVRQLQTLITSVHERYQLPIWVTEYALIHFSHPRRYPTPAQQAAFITASTRMLDSLPYVERYAWFSLHTPSNGTAGTGLYWPNGVATLAGRTYRAA